MLFENPISDPDPEIESNRNPDPILNRGRGSNAIIQRLIKFQNKARKIINPKNMGSLEDHFQHLNILCLPKLYSFQ